MSLIFKFDIETYVSNNRKIERIALKYGAKLLPARDKDDATLHRLIFNDTSNARALENSTSFGIEVLGLKIEGLELIV